LQFFLKSHKKLKLMRQRNGGRDEKGVHVRWIPRLIRRHQQFVGIKIIKERK
jgi:hypothetical protein